MNQKTIAVVVIAVVVVAVISYAGYWMLSSEGTGEPEPTPTPTGIEGASSLQLTIEITGGDAAGTYEYMAKNIGTDDMSIRVEIPIGEMDLVYIVNGALQKAWANEGSGWVDLSDAFTDQWDAWKATWDVYTSELTTWTEGDWTYTDTDGSTVKIANIQVNPSLEDSLFEVTT